MKCVLTLEFQCDLNSMQNEPDDSHNSVRPLLIEHVPHHAIPSADNAQGSRGGDAQMEHCFTANELPDGGSHDSASICHA